MSARRLGVMFRPQWPAEELLTFARAAERDGFEELWLAEDCFLAGGLAMSASALAVTERLTVGIGLLPAAARNAAITAMEIAALGRLFPGRFVAGFGHGVDAWMRQIDARPADRIAALEETVAAVRALLAGEEHTLRGGHVRLDAVTLDQPPQPAPPVVVGTTGPRGLAIAGRAADGIVLPEGSGPAAVRWAREQAAAAGSAGTTTVYAWLSIDDDAAAAVAAIRPEVEAWAGTGLYPRLTELAGIGEDGSGPLGDDAIRAVAIVGDAGECAQAIEDLWAAGADSVVVFPRHDAREAQLLRFKEAVRPRLAC